jgi:hypothetical protein
MDNQLPTTDVELLEVDQIAIVVEDLQEGVERYSTLLDIEPCAVHRLEPRR